MNVDKITRAIAHYDTRPTFFQLPPPVLRAVLHRAEGRGLDLKIVQHKQRYLVTIGAVIALSTDTLERASRVAELIHVEVMGAEVPRSVSYDFEDDEGGSWRGKGATAIFTDDLEDDEYRLTEEAKAARRARERQEEEDAAYATFKRHLERWHKENGLV